jgi:hypothetical protein
MCCLLRLLRIDAAKHCLPGDRVSGCIPLSKQDVEQICGMATNKTQKKKTHIVAQHRHNITTWDLTKL